MKLIRIGCGCTMLVVHEADTLAKSVVRLIDSCYSVYNEPTLRIGKKELMDEHANPCNLEPDKVQELSADEVLTLLDRIADLVNDGYRFQELQRILKSTVGQ